MSHELTIRSNGFVEMAYAGEGAWHGLGNQLERGATIEQWKQAAGMDWRIKRAKVRFQGPSADGQRLETYTDESNHVLFRSDSKAPLGIVSNKFKVVQPGEVLEFFRDLVAGNGFQMETAGTLFGGRKFWALAKITEAIVGRADKIGGYCLLATACDGSMNTTADFTSTRVVCMNTLRQALSSKSSGVVKVSHRSEFDADAVKAQLGVGQARFATFIGAVKDLSKAHISPVDAQELTMRLLGAKKLAAAGNDAKKVEAAVEDIRNSKGFVTVMALFEGKGLGSDMDTAKGTAWGWVNAVTQYVDYAAPARSQDNRLNSAWFGDGADLKTTALESALAFI